MKQSSFLKMVQMHFLHSCIFEDAQLLNSDDHQLLSRILNQLYALKMQGQIPCSARWHCSIGFGGTGPMTPSEDLAERQSASASA